MSAYALHFGLYYCFTSFVLIDLGIGNVDVQYLHPNIQYEHLSTVSNVHLLGN